MGNHGVPPRKNDPNQQPARWMWLVVMLLLMTVLATRFAEAPDVATQQVAYSEIKDAIRDGRVIEVTLEENEITAAVGKAAGDANFLQAVTPTQGDPDLLPLLESRGVKVTAVAPRGQSILIYLLPWVLILGFYFWMSRKMMGGIGGMPRGMGDLLRGRFSKPVNTTKKVTFDDVAGQDSAKKEVAELVDFLRDPDRFLSVGAQVPHGVLLMGPPGTGKTLLARALAGEADVPFFSTTGSEFIEVFVGVGASRVRKMFEEARKKAPAIIFIDELDSIGRTRGTGLGGGHDEREQTLNQILAELDGFSGREAVVVLAATNRPDVLDPALLRPGRFDRHVTLSLPDRKARLAILNVHAKNLPLASDTDLDVIAGGTPGFSGADLKNLLNEAAINAARKGAKGITHADLDEARDKVMMGTVRTLAIQPEEKHRLAVHEAGHTLVAYHTPDADPLYKVTIIPRGRSLGGTHMLPEHERHTLPEGYLRAQLSTLLAGRAAEKILLGSVSSGADDDIKRATSLARSMVARWGMDDDLGPVDLSESEEHPFLGQTIAQPRHFSDQTAAQVDKAVMELLHEAEQQAFELIKAHRRGIERLIRQLETQEVLDADEIRICLEKAGNVTPITRKQKPTDS